MVIRINNLIKNMVNKNLKFRPKVNKKIKTV